MYIVEKTFEFSASHSLSHLPKEHPCHNVHGHNYQLKVSFKSHELNQDYFVIDYRKIKELVSGFIEMLDHSHLNDYFPITTSERMAKHIYTILKKENDLLYSVSISETNSTICTYYEE